MKLLLAGLLSACLATSCAPKFRQPMMLHADDTKSALPLPNYCTPVEELHLKTRDIKRLSAFISEQNQFDWVIDIRRHDVCLRELVAQNHLGLFSISSPASSHWSTQYFIKGRGGISVIKLMGDSAKTAATVRAALKQQEAGLSSELIARIASYRIN